MTKLHIEEVVGKDSTYPMIIYFQNGYATEYFKDITCTVLDNELNGKRTILTEVDRIVYAGEEENEDLGNTFILARNRNTGKVRLIEVVCAELKPYFAREKDAAPVLDTSSLELSRELLSNKGKKITEQHEELKVNADMVTEQMRNATKNDTEDKIVKSPYITKSSYDFYVPPMNGKAKHERDLYDIDKILSDEQFLQIHSELVTQDYVAEYHPIVKIIVKDKDLDMKRKVLAAYASALLKAYFDKSRQIKKKSYSCCQASQTIHEIVVNNFTLNTKPYRTRHDIYKNKTLYHAIVFCFILNDFHLDLDLLCKHLKLPRRSAEHKARAIGAWKFGSKKSKKLMEKLKDNAETVTAQMRNATKNDTEDKIDKSQYITKNSYDFYVPPINRKALVPEDLYDIDKILSDEQFLQIHSELVTQDYVAEYDPLVKIIVKDKDLDMKRKVLAAYASALLKAYFDKSTQIRKKSYSCCTASPTIHEIVVNNFTLNTKTGRTRNEMYKDKTLYHAIIFCLILNDYYLDLDLLCKRLKLSERSGEHKIRAVGASIVLSAKKSIVRFRLPLRRLNTFTGGKRAKR